MTCGFDQYRSEPCRVNYWDKLYSGENGGVPLLSGLRANQSIDVSDQTPISCRVKSLLCEVEALASDAFTGLGFIVSNGASELPVYPLRLMNTIPISLRWRIGWCAWRREVAPTTTGFIS